MLSNSLTMHADAISEHYRMCIKCADNPAIKEQLINIVLLIMDGTNPSSTINHVALDISNLMSTNHAYVKDGRTWHPRIEFLNKELRNTTLIGR